jgi:hypothetical protein
MISSIISILRRLLEIVKFSFKLRHVMLSFAFAVHLFLAAPSMGQLLLVHRGSSWQNLQTAWFARISSPRHKKLLLYFSSDMGAILRIQLSCRCVAILITQL